MVDPREKASRTPPAVRAKSAMAEPKWKLQVEQLMACNCNWGCPCSFDAPPTYGRCETDYRPVCIAST